MKNLIDILLPIGQHEVFGDSQKVVNGIAIDSRKVVEGAIYIAIKGTTQDGHMFIQQSIDKGASVIVCEKLPEALISEVCYVKVRNTSHIAGLMASAFYDYPSIFFKLVGVTGTNGKTTCTTLLYNLFTALGYKVGLISTVKYIIVNQEFESTHTTPDAIRLQELMHQMMTSGCDYVFMEVSSHAVDQRRIAGLDFDGAVFTNITRDHLDYHHTFDEYIAAKKMFFDELPSSSFAIVNKDDKRGLVMLQNTKAQKYTFSINGTGDFNARLLENTFEGLMLSIDNTDVYTKLIGKFNAYNFISVYAVATLLGIEKHKVLATLSGLSSAEGRFDFIKSKNKNIIGVVDYAHTPDALLNVLQTAQQIKEGSQNLICVIGCGGDRDKGKRPLMGEVAATHADQIIFTSDNPRSEDPMTIINEIVSGVPVHLVKKTLIQVDRYEAIKTACKMAAANDVILLAGKGHEKYQEINGVKNKFDDKEILITMLNELEL